MGEVEQVRRVRPGEALIPARDMPELKGGLTIQARLSQSALGEASFDELYAEIRLDATEVLPEVRPALNVALVIDRSGSMQGEPMAQARAAARAFVEGLSAQDRVALVSFAHTSRVDRPTVLADEAGKRALLSKIEELYASGATNISDGLQDGFEQVKRNREPNTVDRVVLMTDGFPNRGLTTGEGLAALTRSIRNQGVTVSTLGFGTGYNAQMLMAMTEEGAGNHRFIEGAQDMAKAFADELEDLQNTVASGIELYLRPARGVEVLNVYGFSRQQDGKEVRITLGDLRASGQRSVLARLRVPADEAPGEYELLRARAQYVDRFHNAPAQASFALPIKRVRDQAAEASVDKAVMARVEEVLAMSSLQKVLELYEKGQVEQAQRQLDAEQRRSARARKIYGIDESARTRQVDSMRDRVGAQMRAAPRPTSAGSRRMINSVSAESLSISQGE